MHGGERRRQAGAGGATRRSGRGRGHVKSVAGSSAGHSLGAQRPTIAQHKGTPQNTKGHHKGRGCERAEGRGVTSKLAASYLAHGAIDVVERAARHVPAKAPYNDGQCWSIRFCLICHTHTRRGPRCVWWRLRNQETHAPFGKGFRLCFCTTHGSARQRALGKS